MAERGRDLAMMVLKELFPEAGLFPRQCWLDSGAGDTALQRWLLPDEH